MLLERTFTPVLRFADDLLMPFAEIEAAQQRLEDAGTAALVEILESETDSLLRRAETALTNGDIPALLSLQWPAAGLMARAIVRIWAEGFAVGAEHGLEEMRTAVADLVPVAMIRRFALADDMAQVLTLDANQLINTDAVAAVLGRSNMLAGNFADDTFNLLRQDLIAAIAPQPGTGNPISRRELVERVQKTLGVGANRAAAIAVTETNYAYTNGRLNSFKQSELVDYVRVIAVTDSRTTQICLSRNGLIAPKNDLSAIGGSPPYHTFCRSTLGAVMSQLSRFQDMVADPNNDPANRSLAPLPTGWRTGATAPPQAPTPTAAPIQPLADIPVSRRPIRPEDNPDYDPDPMLASLFDIDGMEYSFTVPGGNLDGSDTEVVMKSDGRKSGRTREYNVEFSVNGSYDAGQVRTEISSVISRKISELFREDIAAKPDGIRYTTAPARGDDRGDFREAMYAKMGFSFTGGKPKPGGFGQQTAVVVDGLLVPTDSGFKKFTEKKLEEHRISVRSALKAAIRANREARANDN